MFSVIVNDLWTQKDNLLDLLSHSELGLAASGLGYLWESPRSLTLAWCTFSAQVALEPEVHPHQHPSRTWVAHCPLALVLLSIPVRVCFWLIYYQHVQNILSSKSLSLTSVSACLKISGLEDWLCTANSVSSARSTIMSTATSSKPKMLLFFKT